ncbi:MAG: hypothetical protein ACHQ01_01840 [Candidatus Limnocylindrales bacterium]
MPQPVAADVEDDPAESLLEAIWIAERFEPSPSQNCGVVRRVFRLGRIAENHAREPVSGVEMAVGQTRELDGPIDSSRSTALSAATACPSFGRSPPLWALISPPLRLTSGPAETFSARLDSFRLRDVADGARSTARQR